MTTYGPTYKIVVVGSGGVGKSTLTCQLVQARFVVAYDPTLEDSYRKAMKIDGENCILDILDTVGQEEYTALRDQYWKAGQGFVLVYDINSAASFNELSEIHDEILRVKETNHCPMIVVANKCDLKKERQVTKLEGTNMAKNWQAPYFETSAKLRINVEECFFELVREIRIDLNPGPSKKGKANSCTLM